MSSDEIVKDIVIALIEKDFFVAIDGVCTAYKQIAEVVNDPLTSNS